MSIAGRKFLLVEDEPVIGFALEDMMIAEGADTQFASSLDEGLSLADAHEFDAAVLDVNLHGRESYPLARKLREKGVDVVFATGYGVEPLPSDLAEVETVAKPYSVESIRAAFARLQQAGT
ncbi:response regulator [Aurantiacibacter odishensis]|uniref:response regulator n=1 Tax=Aurantiacibacter odishensis TaxID=1155476 RepID=UPI000E76F6D4|nr:response regulator [Aurantiacibacter odishensis]